MTHSSHGSGITESPAARRSLNTAVGESLAVRRRQAREMSPAAIVTLCAALHLIAATLVYRDMARDLYVLFDAAPRLLVLERGLVRLTAVSVFLPPIIPTTLIIGIAAWLGGARRSHGVARWLALAVVPLSIDSVLRAVGVLLASPPSAVGELLELPTRFSIGPRMVLDLAGVRPSPGVAYWVVVCTVAAVLSAWCVSRAVLAADAGEHEAARRRRARAGTTFDALRAGVMVSGSWIALAFSGQVALPWATQLFLRAFG